MRILHTSDWHLGKYLEGQSRLDEQEKFMADIIDMVEEENIDLIIIAGDIYDTSNPPAKAEKLFYESVKTLSNSGERIVLIIGGNHDSPERLGSSKPLATEQGIILLGKPKDTLEIGKLGNHQIIASGEGYLELLIKDEKAVIITLPYPSEQRLEEVFSRGGDEEEIRLNYSEKVGEIFRERSKKYREDTINLATSHLFVLGGQSTDSERPIQIGGGLTVDSFHLPKEAQYIALGHLHRAQRVGNTENAYYSGSPLQYSKSEANHRKFVYIVDVEAGEPADIEKVEMKIHKPIEIWKCNGVDEAIEKCIQNKDREVWVYLEIVTDRVITNSEIKSIKDIKSDILTITPIVEDRESEAEIEEDFSEKGIVELFEEFYISENDLEATDELLDVFQEIISESGEEDEA